MAGPNYFNFISPDNNFLDLKLYQCGQEACEPLHLFGPATRNHYLFHYVISGSGILHCRGTDLKEHEYTICDNQGFLLSPEQVSTYIADEHNPWKYVWLEFDGLRVEEALLNAGLDWDQPVFFPETIRQGEQLRDRMLYIVENNNSSPMHLLGHLWLFLDQLNAASARKRIQTEKRISDFYVQEAVGYIQEHYRRDLTIEEVSNFCKINRDQFTRRFKRAIGCTPQEYLIRLRLTTAAGLLRDTEDPIKDIAASCGYPNPLHFSQAFKNFYGISPREWRKKSNMEKI